METPRSNHFILVATCHFTKRVEFFALPDKTVTTCARTLLNGVFSRYGICSTLHTDQGRNFESMIFRNYVGCLRSKKSRTSVRHPRCNGQTERFNRTLVRMIKAYLKDKQTDWDLNLGLFRDLLTDLLLTKVPNLPPNILMLGREVRLPAELIHGSYATPGEQITSYGDYVDRLRERLQTAHSIARKNIAKSAVIRKDRYDANLHQISFIPDDLVWYFSEVCKPGRCSKLEPTYSGPYVITCKFNLLNFKIQLDRMGTSKVVHHNKLKRYEGESPLQWATQLSKKIKNRGNDQHTKFLFLSYNFSDGINLEKQKRASLPVPGMRKN